MTDIARDRFEEIRRIALSYFHGLYKADVELLRSLFHETATLQAPGLRLTRDEWLERVGSRPIPRDEGSREDFEILAMDIEQSLATVKVFCPLFQHCYIDFLTLLKEDGRWLIVNKTYADSLTFPPHYLTEHPNRNGENTCPISTSK